ncbi:MAG: sugar ABC transporter ATP-binding protein [Pseudomonadota bacterium]
MDAPLFLEGMTKRYGATVVLEDVSLTLHPGRIHALMGENGAGKSTLIKLIAGVVPADRMVARRGDQTLPLRSASDAAAAGFRFIHQELNIVPQLSVAENILLGHRSPTRLGVLVNWRKMAHRAETALRHLGVSHIDPRAPAGDLSTGDRMLIKLASALVADPGARPGLYVLDEPTAALKETEVERLFNVLRGLRDEGAALLYVSHRIAEIEEICDDVTVLRNGRHVSTRAMTETRAAQIVHDMTGKEVTASVPARIGKPGVTPILRLRDVRTDRLEQVSFTLARGEILGLAGLAGAGQTELLRLCLGLERLRGGEAGLQDDPLPASPSAAWAAGVAYVPQERRSEGLMMGMGARANSLLPHLRGLLAQPGSERRRSRALTEQVRLKATSVDQPVWRLSGGNQQKVVFARALAGQPRLLLLDEPTRGVDIGARQEIYRLIRALAGQGCACLLASSDLPEIVGLSDRILILQNGQQTALLPAKGLTPEALLTGIYDQDNRSRAG